MLFIVSTFLFLFLEGCNTTSSTDSNNTISQTSVLLPLYSYPTEWENSTQLTNLRLATRAEIIAVINPSSGPGLFKNSDYVKGIEYLFFQKIKVIGYISTSYGNRDKQKIYDEIDAYLSFYGKLQLSGIFFDEVVLDTLEEQNYIKDIAEYAKNQGYNFIVLNSGTHIEQSIINENYYDIIVTYENSYANYLNFNNGMSSASKTKQALLVYSYPTLSSYRNEIEKAKNMHFDYIYLTVDTEPNPWDTIFNFIK